MVHLLIAPVADAIGAATATEPDEAIGVERQGANTAALCRVYAATVTAGTISPSADSRAVKVEEARVKPRRPPKGWGVEAFQIERGQEIRAPPGVVGGSCEGAAGMVGVSHRHILRTYVAG